jgi:hypothetical protein
VEAIGIGKFLSRTPAAEQLTEKIIEWDYMKFKVFCMTKEMVSELKRLPTEWEKIFGIYTLNNGLITRIINSPQINEPVRKWASELFRIFQKKKSKWPTNT